MTSHVAARARIELASAARKVADLARSVVGDISTSMQPGERIRKVRATRMGSLTMVDLAVLADLADGCTWEQVADALGLPDPDPQTGESATDTAKRRYGLTWRQWLEEGPGDEDLAVEADVLDAWWLRHAEPWETPVPGPVAQVLVDGETSPSDS